MIDLTTLLLYSTGAIVIIMSPGPDFLFVITKGIAQGRKAGIYSAFGISVGLVVHTILAAMGLSALVQTSGIAFQTIKYIGAAYLIYLGIKLIIDRNNSIQYNSPDNGELKKGALFRQGVITNVFNPKAVITFMAFIPQFISSTDGGATYEIIVFGSIISFLAIVWFGVVGYFAGSVGRWLSSQVYVQKIINLASGFILVGLGLRLALIKKNNSFLNK